MKIEHLKAAAVCGSKKDLRHTLNGVFVEFGKKEIRAVATDGHVMAVLREPNDTVYQDWSFIVPMEVIAQIKPKNGLIEFRPMPDVNMIRAQWDGGMSLEFRAIDGVYPDYRRVTPERTDGIAGDFDPELMARFGKVAAALSYKSICVVLHQNGKGGTAGVTITGYEDFAGVIVPLNFTKPEQRSDWVTWVKER